MEKIASAVLAVFLIILALAGVLALEAWLIMLSFDVTNSVFGWPTITPSFWPDSFYLLIPWFVLVSGLGASAKAGKS